MNSPADSEAQAKLNTLVGAFTIEVLARLGVEFIVTAPGSRCTSLTVAAANNEKIHSVSILDERSAGFFALGKAKVSRKPVALVCTSGTAAANFYPAVIESQISNIPLIVITCDRPFELRNCSAGQVIDQIKLFGNNVNDFYEIGLPENTEIYFNYLRQTLVHIVSRTCGLNKGPIHLNFSFREPLTCDQSSDTELELDELLNAHANVVAKISEHSNHSISPEPLLVEKLTSHRKGLIVVGNAQELSDDIKAIESIGKMSKALGWPIIADVLNPLRSGLASLGKTHLITHYDFFLRKVPISQTLSPTAVLQIGTLPTSKVFRSFLQSVSPVQFLLCNGFKNIDPINAHSIPLISSVDALSASIEPCQKDEDWLNRWLKEESNFSKLIDESIKSTDFHFEGKIARLISENIPENTDIFLANSMTVRYAESFWQQNSTYNSIYCNRGANGIDGTLSSAMGMAYLGKPSILLTGDLAFLHDSNGLLNAKSFKGDLLVILINNEGGGIFEHLPISNNKHFEDYFATPQSVDFETYCKAHHVNYELVENESTLVNVLKGIQGLGLKVIEIKTNRKEDAKTFYQINHQR